jgi:hypothetical protein
VSAEPIYEPDVPECEWEIDPAEIEAYFAELNAQLSAEADLPDRGLSGEEVMLVELAKRANGSSSGDALDDSRLTAVPLTQVQMRSISWLERQHCDQMLAAGLAAENEPRRACRVRAGSLKPGADVADEILLRERRLDGGSLTRDRQRGSKLKALEEKIAAAERELLAARKQEALEQVERQFAGEAA